MSKRELNNYEDAKDILEKGLSIYRRNATKDYSGLARALVYLGHVYRNLGGIIVKQNPS